MKKIKIAVTTGTRAEYGIIRKLLYGIKKSKKLKLILIVTGSHLSKKHGFTVREIIEDGFNINSKIRMNPKNDDAFSSSVELGNAIIEFARAFRKFKPDINVVLGDRDEMLASAIAASHMNIINVHIHGGDISGGIDEYNRHAITKLSNVHFTATQKSKERVIRMGENPKFVLKTGSPSIDEILENKITPKKELEKKYQFTFTDSELLLIQHPVTTQIKDSKNQIEITLKALIKTKKNIIAIAPNADPGNSAIFKYMKKMVKIYPRIRYFENLPRTDYLGFLQNCAILIGNSSSGIVESTLFDIRVIDLGIRQKGREREDSVINIEKPTIEKIYVEVMKSMKSKQNNCKKRIYGDGNATKRILKYLESITINKQIIQKQFNC